MESFQAGDLAIDYVDALGQGAMKLLWRGKSNDRHPARILSPFFERVMNAAESQGAAIEMHFEELDHFNSSTITALIQLIQDARERNVRLVIVFDKTLKWQKLSFDALRVFSRGDDLLQLRSA
jgi:hypothetical protein